MRSQLWEGTTRGRSSKAQKETPSLTNTLSITLFLLSSFPCLLHAASAAAVPNCTTISVSGYPKRALAPYILKEGDTCGSLATPLNFRNYAEVEKINRQISGFQCPGKAGSHICHPKIRAEYAEPNCPKLSAPGYKKGTLAGISVPSGTQPCDNAYAKKLNFKSGRELQSLNNKLFGFNCPDSSIHPKFSICYPKTRPASAPPSGVIPDGSTTPPPPGGAVSTASPPTGGDVAITCNKGNSWSAAGLTYVQYDCSLMNTGSLLVLNITLSCSNFLPTSQWNINPDCTFPNNKLYAGQMIDFGYQTTSGPATFTVASYAKPQPEVAASPSAVGSSSLVLQCSSMSNPWVENDQFVYQYDCNLENQGPSPVSPIPLSCTNFNPTESWSINSACTLPISSLSPGQVWPFGFQTHDPSVTFSVGSGPVAMPIRK